MKNGLMAALTAMAFLAGCSGGSNEKQHTFAIIPAPLQIVKLSGSFTVSSRTKMMVYPLDSLTSSVAGFIAGMLRESAGVPLPVSEATKAGRNMIVLRIDTSLTTGKEGYTLEATRKNIVLTSPSAAGLFRGAQTLRQLLPPQVESAGGLTGEVRPVVPACLISDEPRFSYRGLHLDVSRHFFSVDEVKRFIDIMALHKFNTFHWHLTDDQGWRLEIKKYPELTGKGSMRSETLIGHGRQQPFKYDGVPHGGYYTQDEAREIVRYASERFITVIPEIEMPGHAVAALAAYPVFSCTGKPMEVQTRWGVFDDVFCAGKDTVLSFLEDVLDEVMAVFPSQYIHVGGDECPKVRWQSCPDCQRRIRVEELADERQLQSWFITRMERYLNSHGRRLIGWDEILEGGLAPEATVMSWRGMAGGIEAAKMGHDVIMTPSTHLYLDYYQSEPDGEPLAIGGYSPLEWVYSFEPVPQELTPDEQKHVLGLQGNVWTEYIPSAAHLEYMAFPRAFAIAETGWTPELKKDFEDFLARFSVLRERYDIMEINYFKGDYRNTRGRTK